MTDTTKPRPMPLAQLGITEVRTKLTLIFLLTSVGAFVTCLGYYLFSQIFYNPLHPLYGGGEVFLLPRSHLAQNDMAFSLFSQWGVLAVVVPSLVAIAYAAFSMAVNRRISFRVFLLSAYILCFLVELLFLFITTPEGLAHIADQTHSINNGIYLGLQQVTDQLTAHGIKDVLSLDSMRYLYGEMYAKIVPGTLPFVGATHPPGTFVLTYLVYGLGVALFPFLSHDTACGVVVALINTSAIIILGLIAKEMFSERIARLSCVMMLCLPSVALHFMAVLDGVASVFIGIGILFLIHALNAITASSKRAHMFYGAGAGVALTLAAQFTFGHAFPILAVLTAFLISSGDIVSQRKRMVQFAATLLIAPTCYFLFEYLVSAGKVFYVALALERAQAVAAGLESRPYPISQVANLIVMSVMGGVVLFPSAILSLGSGLTMTRNLTRKPPARFTGKERIRNYLLFSVFVMVLLLLFQKTVRLEVERTWHWFFLPVWALMGYLFYGIHVFFRRLFPAKKGFGNLPVLLFCLVQLAITVALAMSIQDYY
ncbi:MAG: hypothetical protein HZB47_07920 [Nitrosomonadales bacterium]|nr:hypothetical protein [Nitrosomonadales bacterium]